MKTHADDTEENIDQDLEQESWIHIILSIPKIGEFLTFVIAVAPAFLLFLISIIFGLLFSIGQDTVSDELSLLLVIVLILTAVPLTWWWLNYLERKINLAILFPIPFIRIRVKWVLYPFMLPYFGIRRVYRYMSPVRNIDNK